MRPRPLSAGALVCAAFLVVASACSGSGNEQGSTSVTTAGKADQRELNGPGCQYIVAGTEKRSTSPGDTLQYLISAVAEPTTCYDKVTFTFDPGDGPDLPPGYTVEYRKPPFVEGITSSAEGFKDAKYVLYVELRPVSTKDTRTSARGATTYKGNLRLALQRLKHTVIVEWLDKAPPSVPEVAATTTTTVAATTSTKAGTKPSGSTTTTRAGGKSSTSTSAPGTATTTPTTAPPGPTTTTTLAPNDPTTARVVWLIGLDSKRPFTVDASNQPPKVSVLIMH